MGCRSHYRRMTTPSRNRAPPALMAENATCRDSGDYAQRYRRLDVAATHQQKPLAEPVLWGQTWGSGVTLRFRSVSLVDAV
jgi:hypothetical protein